MEWVQMIIVFFFGLFFGSFANVCIWRLPRAESIVFPNSHCPHCQTPICWYDNIPLLSFILLGGRCRSCRQPISWRYPIIEVFVGVMGVLLFWKFQLTSSFFAYSFVTFILIIITIIDFNEQVIPDELNYVLLIGGTIYSFWNPSLYLNFAFYLPAWVNRLFASYVGLLVGGGLLYLIAWISRGGMGGGDIKLAAALGTFLGWEKTLVMLGLSFFMGGIIGVILLLSGKKKRRDPIPFGPFIAAGSFLVIVFRETLLAWGFFSLFSLY